MSKLDILNQNWIDIVFAGRNRDYGAYQLRQENNKNTNKAVIAGVLLFSLAIASPLIVSLIKGSLEDKQEKFKETEVVLTPPPSIDKAPPPPPPVPASP